MAEADKKSQVDRWLDKIKNNRIAAAIIVLSIGVIGISSAWQSVQNICCPQEPPDHITQRASLDVTASHVLRYTDDDRQISFEIDLHNSGDTPAHIEPGALRILSLTNVKRLPVPPADFTFLTKQLKDISSRSYPLEVPAKGDAVLRTFLCFCIEPMDQKDDRYLFGYLVYRDVFGNSHDVKWGWLVDLTDAYVTDGRPHDVGEFNTEEAVDGETVEGIFRHVELTRARR